MNKGHSPYQRPQKQDTTRRLLPLLTVVLAATTLMSCSGNQPRPTREEAFFQSKRQLLTATWDRPFCYDSIRSTHAPLGPYMGNGDVGCVSYTDANSQTILISKVDFVTDNYTDWTGTGPGALPVGGLRIAVDAEPETKGFNYEMDILGNEWRMDTGTSPQVHMTSWLTMGENLLVTRLSGSSHKPVTITVQTYAGGTTPHYPTTATVNNDIAQVTRQTNTENVRWTSQAGISTKILGATSSTWKVSDNRIETSFPLSSRQDICIITCVSGGGTANDARLEQACQRLQSLKPEDIGLLQQRKEAWWKDMWTRSYVETNDSLLDRHYLSSIYLMASACNEYSPACGGMYGVWNMDDQMNYHGDIHLNYNSQAGFYSAFSANRPHLAMPFYRFLEKMVPEGRRRAREELGLVHPSLKGKSYRGILFPISALDIGGFYCTYWQQTMNAPFNVPLFSWYYEYTGDTNFLRHRAYPFIRECGDFYEDYLQKEPYGDSYRYTITTGGHENSWDLNPPSDLAFVQQTFGLLLRYSRLLGIDEERRDKWHDILAHLPGYKVIMPTRQPNQGLPIYAKNEAGWDWPSHVIQLHAAYPCEVLNLASDPEALQTARNTLYYYGVSQQGLTHTMNELGLSAFVMGARIGFDPNILVEKLKYLIATAGKNFLITDGHHCLEKTAAVETINSMMLQSVNGIIHLFPNWLRKPASFTRLRTKGGFLVTADYDGHQVTSLSIQGGFADTCRFVNPWAGRPVRVRANGQDVPLDVENGICLFPSQAGLVYEVMPE